MKRVKVIICFLLVFSLSFSGEDLDERGYTPEGEVTQRIEIVLPEAFSEILKEQTEIQKELKEIQKENNKLKAGILKNYGDEENISIEVKLKEKKGKSNKFLIFWMFLAIILLILILKSLKKKFKVDIGKKKEYFYMAMLVFAGSLLLVWLLIEGVGGVLTYAGVLTKPEWSGVLSNYYGGVLGGLIAIYGIHWQMSREEEEKKKRVKVYIKNIIDRNINMKDFKENLLSGEKILSWRTFSIAPKKNEYLYKFSEKYIDDNVDTILTLKGSCSGGSISEDIFLLKSYIEEYNYFINELLLNSLEKKRVILKLKEHYSGTRLAMVLEGLEILSIVFKEEKEEDIKWEQIEDSIFGNKCKKSIKDIKKETKKVSPNNPLDYRLEVLEKINENILKIVKESFLNEAIKEVKYETDLKEEFFKLIEIYNLHVAMNGRALVIYKKIEKLSKELE